jgi:hypothetical protein
LISWRHQNVKCKADNNPRTQHKQTQDYESISLGTLAAEHLAFSGQKLIDSSNVRISHCGLLNLIEYPALKIEVADSHAFD